jgi:hypothetical protein
LCQIVTFFVKIGSEFLGSHLSAEEEHLLLLITPHGVIKLLDMLISIIFPALEN